METNKEQKDEIRPWVRNLFERQPQQSIFKKHQFPNKRVYYRALILQSEKLNKNSKKPDN